ESFPSSHPSVIVAYAPSAPKRLSAAHRLPAPADEILSTTPRAGYAFFTGTSLAAAHLSGVIALLLERAPSLDACRVADSLAATVSRGGDEGSVSACVAREGVSRARVCGPAADQRLADF